MVEVTCVICNREFEAKRRSKKCCSKECNKKYINRQRKEYMREYMKNNTREYMKKYMKKYYQKNLDKYDLHRFKVSNKNIERKLEKQKHSDNVIDVDYSYKANPSNRKHTCNECGTEFSYQYEISPIYKDNIKIDEINRHWNITPWGVPVCPKCGLVGVFPDIDHLSDKKLKENPPRVLSKDEGMAWWTSIRFTKNPPKLKPVTERILGPLDPELFDKIFQRIPKSELHDFGIDFIQEAITVRKMANRIHKKRNPQEEYHILSKKEISEILKVINS